ncbi:MAG: hypothetical protein A4E26_01613 [Methanobacterium sp. PtaU1.Bin097]|nr:MAG: hypothetical protein A4E26_01613 [Methanobacterium sp. PtaU1.Bin097]
MRLIDTAKKDHECKYESRWNKYFDWREKVNDFISTKTTTNGHLELEDKKLEKRLSSIENRLWWIIGILITFMFSIIVYTIFK